MHGQRFALEYASLKPDRHPALQAREMLRKARFADPGDVFAIHMEAEILLAIVDGDTWLIEGTQRWGISSHPYEPCIYITPPGRETIVVHNAFNVPDALMPLAHGKSIRSIIRFCKRECEGIAVLPVTSDQVLRDLDLAFAG